MTERLTLTQDEEDILTLKAELAAAGVSLEAFYAWLADGIALLRQKGYTVLTRCDSQGRITAVRVLEH